MRRVSISPWNGDQVWSGSDDRRLAEVARQAADQFGRHRQRSWIRERLDALGAAITAQRATAVDLLVREAGKVRADAEAEVDLLGRKIALTLGAGLERTPLISDVLDIPRRQVDPLVRWRPRGPALCVGPFNFPLHLLHGLVVPALAAGCSVVAKPSERTPALGCWYRDRLRDAGLAELAQVVIGGAPTVRALIRSGVFATVAAVGSQAMGCALAKLLAPTPSTVLALELGGINHALLCEDADLDKAIPVIADGAWRMAGQRCTATRIVHVPQRLAERTIDRLIAARQGWIPIGTPLSSMGPMIAAAQRERFQAAFRDHLSGFDHLAGAIEGAGAFAEPLLQRVQPAGRAHPRYRDEHFGPALLVDVYDREDDAIARMAANPMRLSAAVWTIDHDRFRAIAPRLPYGLVGWNRSTAGARSDQPFGGCGTSGNGRPAAVAAGAIFADETVVG